MHKAFEVASAPAILVKCGGEKETLYECNRMCRRFLVTVNWAEDQWLRLAHQIAEQCARHGESGDGGVLRNAEGDPHVAGIGWNWVLTDEGILAWLLDLNPAATEPSAVYEEHRARESVLLPVDGFGAMTSRILDDSPNFRAQRAVLAMQVGGFGVWYIDNLTNEPVWDEQMYRMRGVDPKTDPRPLTEIRRACTHPDDHDMLLGYTADMLRRLHAGLLPNDFLGDWLEFRVFWPDGQIRWLASRTTVLHDENNKPYLMGLHWDITDRKRVEELSRQNAVARESSETKSRFLANMSHELRTPMNAVLGMMHLALRTAHEGAARDYIIKGERSAKGLLGVLSDILDLSRIDAGKLDINHAPFRLSDTLQNVIDAVGSQLRSEHVELVLSFPVDLPDALIGDALRLGQILINLGNHAAGHTPQGEIEIHAAMQEHTKDQVQLEFSVRDTGIGMDQQTQQSLFEPFEQPQVDPSQVYGVTGLGLGLVISRHLIGRMGGTLSLVSAPGAGSCFRFTVPLAVQPDPSPQPAVSDTLRQARILIVEENRCAATALRVMVAGLGLKALVTDDSDQALRYLQAALSGKMRFDLVLLNHKPPDIDGIALARRIAALGPLAPTLLLMCTGLNRESMEQAFAAQAVAYRALLHKPILPLTLVRALRAALEGNDSALPKDPPSGSGMDKYRNRLAGLHVLLVEDNEINQELTIELLQDVGVEVSLANNGERAIEAICARQFDGVLMDCQMPVMNGFDATRRIRKLPDIRQIPIVAMTANAMSGDREAALACGMNDHVAKPIDVHSLYETLCEWMGKGAVASG